MRKREEKVEGGEGGAGGRGEKKRRITRRKKEEVEVKKRSAGLEGKIQLFTDQGVKTCRKERSKRLTKGKKAGEEGREF